MSKPSISVIVRFGQYGEKHKEACLPIDEKLMRDMCEPMEISDEPLSLILSGGGFAGGSELIKHRPKVFKLRREAAKLIAEDLTKELIRLFGSDDELNGYRAEDVATPDRIDAFRRAAEIR